MENLNLTIETWIDSYNYLLRQVFFPIPLSLIQVQQFEKCILVERPSHSNIFIAFFSLCCWCWNLKAVRDSVILYTMSFIVPLTFNLTLIALPLKALDSGLTRGTVALVVLVSNALQIPGRPIFGYIGDKIGTKIPIMLANILYAFAYFAYYFPYDLITILVSALIQGLAVSMFWSSVFSHNVRLAWADSAFSIGSMLSTSFMGSVVGAFFSGYLVEWFGYDQVFYYSSIIMLASFALSIPLKNIGGSGNVDYKVAFKITLKNV